MVSLWSVAEWPFVGISPPGINGEDWDPLWMEKTQLGGSIIAEPELCWLNFVVLSQKTDTLDQIIN